MNSKKRLKTASGIIILSAFLLLILYLYLDDEKISLNEQSRSKLGGNFIKLPRGVVHYEIAGPQNGSVVVLIHGFSVPQYVWDPTFDMLTSSGFRVLRYDLYGRGYSDRPECEYNLELYVEQLSQLLSAYHRLILWRPHWSCLYKPVSQCSANFDPHRPDLVPGIREKNLSHEHPAGWRIHYGCLHGSFHAAKNTT
jgi:hypothetical protein